MKGQVMVNNEVTESENNVEVADQHDVLEDTVEVVEGETPSETTETGAETETPTPATVTENETEEPVTPKQSNEDNKVARLARKQAEKEAEARIEKARKEAYEQGLKQGRINGFIGKTNPYTGNEIKDELDAQEYQDMYQLDVDGSADPVSDYRELQKARAREEARKQIALDEENKQKLWYANDAKEFVDKYGEDKLQEVLKDADFDMFANGKVGKQPLTKIYEDFNKLTNKYRKDSIETAKRIVANNTATPGAINDGEHQEFNWNTMSSKQFADYVKKAKDGDLRT